MSSGRACSMMWIGHYGFDSGDGRIVAFGHDRSANSPFQIAPKHCFAAILASCGAGAPYSPTQLITTEEAAMGTSIDMKFEIVVIPVSDVDRAKDFYGRLGWRLDAEFANGDDFRVIQFTP